MVLRGAACALLACAVLAACEGSRYPGIGDDARRVSPKEAADVPGRLTARPGGRPTERPLPPGTHDLPIGGARNGLVHVAGSYDPSRPAPLVIALHGASGRASGRLFGRHFHDFGLVVVTPESRGRNWDIILEGGFGTDVAWLDRVLRWAFERFRIDPRRIALAGFSDGASYALSLGLTNGDLFTHVMAFAAGFMQPAELVGEPKVFVSHGRSDQVLPFENAAEGIVPQLEEWGYDVRFQPFDGEHDAPLGVTASAARWFLGRR